MFARHVTVKGAPDKVDEAVQVVQDQVLPVLRECAGFSGQLLLVDRDKGEAIGISLWDTRENMIASEDKVAATRQQAADSVNAETLPEVRLLELPLYEKV